MFRLKLLDSATDIAGYFHDVMKLAEKDPGQDPFGGLRQAVTKVGASAYRLILAFAVLVIAMTCFVAAVRLSKDARKREEGKEKLIAAFIAAGILASLLSIVTFIGYVVEQSITG